MTRHDSQADVNASSRRKAMCCPSISATDYLDSICGSLLTFEHNENDKEFGFDKVIMLAGGIGFGKKKDSLKDIPNQHDRIIMMGGDNYRIGMGGGAVSSYNGI